MISRTTYSGPSKFTDIEDLIAEWESDPAKVRLLAAARQWTVEAGLLDDAETLRSLRLAKGWSQHRLASEIGTSQAHIARIERGTKNGTLQTCRRLAASLEVDLSALNREGEVSAWHDRPPITDGDPT